MAPAWLIFLVCAGTVNQCVSKEPATVSDAVADVTPIQDRLKKFCDDNGINLDFLKSQTPDPASNSLNIPYWDKDNKFEADQKFIIPMGMDKAFERFVKKSKSSKADGKRVWYKGTNYYKDHLTTGEELIEKCLTKRAIWFLSDQDATKLRGKTKRKRHEPDWEKLGTKEYEADGKHHFSIMNYESYDEMQLCAFGLVAGLYTFCLIFLDNVQNKQAEHCVTMTVKEQTAVRLTTK